MKFTKDAFKKIVVNIRSKQKQEPESDSKPPGEHLKTETFSTAKNSEGGKGKGGGCPC